ncbi:lipoprotein [Winogradskyella sp. DF17]|uniref:Lipoprotein n=1 Tax=Winogradskyella pelagia TaxID=2819984 RepID=A0ABS3T392_9FLAO|nr:lipoprotein [Winogradskyella sp. DF17]MBO3116215.1 lipoprotein [Winogradskyella sp. DF17]
MKKLVLIICALAVVTACQQKETRYTQQSPEIDSVKQLISEYNAQDYSMEVMADTCKSYLNTKTDFLSKGDLMAYHKGNDANYSKRGFLDEDQDYEMVVTDNGETWVNCWLDWQGTVAVTGKVIDMPVHLTYRFVDGKIVRQYGYWDPSEIVLEMQAIEQMENAKSEEDSISEN